MEVNKFIAKPRLIFFFSAMLLFLIVLIVQFSRLMLQPPPAVKLPAAVPQRGSICDRNGRLLAMQTTLYNLTANKTILQSSDDYAPIIAPLISMDEDTLIKKVENSPSNFLYLKKKLTENEKDFVVAAIEKNKMKGLRIEPAYSRIYPESNLASTVVGFLGDDGVGLTGIEYSLQDILSPPDTPTEKNRQGYRVMLTLDTNIQYLLKKITAKTLETTKGESAVFLAVQAKTGEILGYVNEPSADLAHFSTSTEEERFDRPAYYIYEPGSVFKIFSLAALMNMGAAHDSDTYICDAEFVFGPRKKDVKVQPNAITCLRKHGQINPRKIIEFSCNDGIAQIADTVQNNNFETAIRGFGFGEKTGIELPGETAGIFAPSSLWSNRSRHTIAMGQEIGVSALQLMQAATVFANEGNLLKLTLVSKIVDTEEDKTVYTYSPEKKRRVISADTARLILSYMESRAQLYSDRPTSIKDISIAIKTGTAQMAKKDAPGYSKDDYVSSCIGLFPANDPEIILYFAVFRPVGETYGSRIAEPAIMEAASEIIDLYGLNRLTAPMLYHSGFISPHILSQLELDKIVPDFTGIPKRQLLPLLSDKRITVTVAGDGYVYSQSPPAGTPVTEGMSIELKLK